MANNVLQYITKYLPGQLDKVYVAGSATAVLERGLKHFQVRWDGAKQVSIMSLYTEGMGNYLRANNAPAIDPYASHYAGQVGEGYRDGFSIGAVANKWTPYQIRYDRSKQFPIDRLDDMENAGQLIAHTLNEFWRTRVVPEKDIIRLATLVANTSTTIGNRVEETAPLTVDNIIAKLDEAYTWQRAHGVPTENLVYFVSTEVMSLIRNAKDIVRYLTQDELAFREGLNKKVIAYNGIPLIEVTPDRFYTLPIFGSDGFYPDTASKDINFILVDAAGVLPIDRLEWLNIYDSTTHYLGFDGYLPTVRDVHDLIVPENKAIGIFANIANDATAGKSANLLYLALHAGSSVGATVVSKVLTQPAGLYWYQLVESATAFTVGEAVTVDGTNIERVAFFDTVEGATFSVTESNAYFAVLDSQGKVVATTPSAIAIPKGA